MPSSPRQASERIRMSPAGQWMEILRDGCYFGIEGKEVPKENYKKKQTTTLSNKEAMGR